MTRNGATMRPQAWDWPGPRVLLEQPYQADTQAQVDALRRAGYAVAVCPGPAAEDRCPLTGDAGCAAARDADIVVSRLGLERTETRDALTALRTRLPRLPVLVEAEEHTASRWPDLVRTGERLEPGLGPLELVGRVDEALAESRSDHA